MDCPKCGSKKVIHFGYVPTVSRGEIPRFRCEKGHTFYLKKDYEKKVKR